MALRDQVDRLRRGRRTLTRGDRLALQDLLSGAGCPACHAREAADRQWFFNYENETNAEPAVKERMARSFGLCTAHTRHLLGLGSSSSWLAKSLFATVAAAGVRTLAESSPPVTAHRCPTCVSGAAAVRTFLDQLVVALAEPGSELSADYRAGDGLCVPHVRALIQAAGGHRGRGGVADVPATALQTVLDVVSWRLDQPGAEALPTLTGIDADRTRRSRPQQEKDEVLQAEAKTRIQSTDAYADWILQAPCCPVCAAADRTAWRFLGWVPSLDEAEVGELRGEALLCPTHLGDLAGAGLGEAVTEVLVHNATYWREQLTPLTTAAARGRHAVRAAAAGVGQWFRCHVCAVRSDARQRELRLLAVLADDPGWSQRLASAHGICFRHVLHERGDNTIPDVLRTLLRARLNMLVFELDESRRKDAWPARWEVKGAEGTVWREAPLLLDGEVLGPRL